MKLVLLRLEPFEKALDPAPAFVAVDDGVLLVVVEVCERFRDRDLRRRRVLQKLLLRPRMLRTRERFDRAFLDREQRIRDDEIVVDADRVTETLADGASPNGELKLKRCGSGSS
jgi:hypothetical protein